MEATLSQGSHRESSSFKVTRKYYTIELQLMHRLKLQYNIYAVIAAGHPCHVCACARTAALNAPPYHENQIHINMHSPNHDNKRSCQLSHVTTYMGSVARLMSKAGNIPLHYSFRFAAFAINSLSLYRLPCHQPLCRRVVLLLLT